MAGQEPGRRRNPPPGREVRRRAAVAGVSGGVGTTTLATAIGGIDRGVFVGRPVDVLVCRGTNDSLLRAGQSARLQTDKGWQRPVLAVTAADSGRLSRAVNARLRLTSPYASLVVMVPFVRRWRDSIHPLQDAASLSSTSSSEVPRGLRPYAQAATEIRNGLRVARPAGVPRPGAGPWGAAAGERGRAR